MLKIDLAPYESVIKMPYGSEETIDILMPAQARYSAWQGSVSIDTRPLGLDSGGMTELFNVQEFYDWREQGGLIMSSALGTEGVRRFYDPSDKTFPAFEIARDAFLAGNDILFIDGFVLDRSEDETKKISRKYTNKIFSGSWNLEGDRRNFGINKCSSEWIIEIDAD